MCVSIESSSFVAAGFGTLKIQVAGFHRAVPSTTLDKACMQFSIIIAVLHEKSSAFSTFSPKIIPNFRMDKCFKNWYDIKNLLGDEVLEKPSQKI